MKQLCFLIAESPGSKLVYNLAVRPLRGKMELVSVPQSEFMFRFQAEDMKNG